VTKRKIAELQYFPVRELPGINHSIVCMPLSLCSKFLKGKYGFKDSEADIING